jgi:septum formation protein
VTLLSHRKAKTVVSLIQSKYDEFIVLGCDTIVLDDSKNVIGKPKDRDHAKRMLESLSSHSHQVLTGCSLIISPNQNEYQTVVTTEVVFRNLSQKEINFYLSHNEWKGKAGGYAIQGLGSLLIKEIKGDYYNVVGLPVNWVWQTLFQHFNGRFLKAVKKKDEEEINLSN